MQSSSAGMQTTSELKASTPSPQQEIPVANAHATVDEKKEGSASDNYKADETQDNSMEPMASNGVVAPEQVFSDTPVVHQATSNLENQFQSMELNEIPNTVHHEKEGHIGENDDEQPVKLFVGQVRCTIVCVSSF